MENDDKKKKLLEFLIIMLLSLGLIVSIVAVMIIMFTPLRGFIMIVGGIGLGMSIAGFLVSVVRLLSDRKIEALINFYDNRVFPVVDTFTDYLLFIVEAITAYLGHLVQQMLTRRSAPAALPFNQQAIDYYIREALYQLSNENVGIAPVMLPTEVRSKMTTRNGLPCMLFRIRRNGVNPLTRQERLLLMSIVQNRVESLIVMENPALLNNGNQRCIITIIDVTQSGPYLIFDVMWIASPQVVEFLNGLLSNPDEDEENGTPPEDEDY